MRLCAGVIFSLIAVFWAAPVSAATLYLDPSETATNKGESVVLTLRLDTSADECINSIDAVINFDPGLQVADVSIGNSIFSLWIEPPVFDNDARTISFAGGVPNGYCGRIDGDPELTNSIAEIIFKIPSFSIGDSGVGPERKVTFADTTNLYLNDGLGTAIKANTSGTKIIVGDNFSGGADDEWSARVKEDTFPPKQFSITLTRDESAFHGDYFIVFNTNDKQTGIDHYEVIEEPINNLGDFDFFKWGGVTAPWKRATSPYVLEDQSLNSVIRVRAIDKAGNEYVASLVPDESMRGVNTDKAILYVLLAFSVIVLLLVIWLLVVHLRRRQDQGSIEHEDTKLKDEEEHDSEE